MSVNKPVELQLTLRDGGQSNEGTKFSAQDFISAFPNAKDYGVFCMQTLGGTFLAEPARNGHNPEEFIGTIGHHFGHNHQTALYRDQFGLSTQIRSLDYHDYTLELLSKAGNKTAQNFHGMNDPEMTAFLPPLAAKHGIDVLGTICFQVNPDTMQNKDKIIQEYVQFAKTLLEQGHKGLYFKSASGVSNAEFTGDMVKAVREAVGDDVYIGIHMHDTYGLAVESYLAAIKAGVNSVDVLPDAYAGGTAQPGISVLMHAIEHSNDPEIIAGKPVNVNLKAIEADANATYMLRGTYHKNEMEYDKEALQKALETCSAGGAISVVKGMTMRTALENALGTKDWGTIRNALYDMKAKFVRPALGYPTNVTPYELMMDLQSAQCIINMKGKKHEDGHNPMSLIHPMALDYLTGKWGKVSDTVDKNVQKRALEMRGLTGVLKPAPIEDRPSDLDAAEKLLISKGIENPGKLEKFVYATLGTGTWTNDDPGKKWVEGFRNNTLTPPATPELPLGLRDKAGLRDSLPVEKNILSGAVPVIFGIAYKALAAQKLRDGFHKGVNNPEILAEKIEAEIKNDFNQILATVGAHGKSPNAVARALVHANNSLAEVASHLGVNKDIIPQLQLEDKHGIAHLINNVTSIFAGLKDDVVHGAEDLRGQIERAFTFEGDELPEQQQAQIPHDETLQHGQDDEPSHPFGAPAI